MKWRHLLDWNERQMLLIKETPNSEFLVVIQVPESFETLVVDSTTILFLRVSILVMLSPIFLKMSMGFRLVIGKCRVLSKTSRFSDQKGHMKSLQGIRLTLYFRV